MQTIYVVDDSSELRKSLCGYLRAAQFQVQSFASAKEFLEVYRPANQGCLLLDIHMPEMSGFELLEQIRSMGATLPVIVVSGHTVVADVVKTMKFSPFDFLEKPYDPAVLLKRIREALAMDLERAKLDAERQAVKARFSKLSPREREVLSWVVAGHPSKHIAEKLGLSTSTVDNHRANLMKKLKAGTSAELTRIALLVDPTLAFPT